MCLSVSTPIAWFQSPTLFLTVASLTIFCNLGGKKVENKIERKGYNNVQNNSCLSPEKLNVELSYSKLNAVLYLHTFRLSMTINPV